MNNGPVSSQNDEEVDLLIEQFIAQYRKDQTIDLEEFIGERQRVSPALRSLLEAAILMEATCQSPARSKGSSDFPNIPKYRIVEELGRGGMGIVYRAEHSALTRTVAVKVLSPHFLPDQKARERFQREARATARLHHTNIVPVFEVGESEEHAFYSMQLIIGQNLDDRIKCLREENNRVPSCSRCTERVSLAAKIGIKIARALQHAHEHQILHRDVKPSNVLIDKDDEVWLSDFGLASICDSQISQSENLVGTLRYLAPERIEGNCDARSDVYSLGLTLYELVALSPAFGGLSYESLLRKDRKLPNLLSHYSEVPRDFFLILEKALQSQPSIRYESAAAFADDLQRFIDGRPIAARPVSTAERLVLWGRRNPTLAILAGSFNCLLIIIAVAASIAAAQFRSLSFRAEKSRIEADAARKEASVKAREANELAEVAQRNEKFATRVSGFFSEMIQGSDPSGLFSGHSQGEFFVDHSTTAFEWIRQASQLIDDEDFQDFPLVEAKLKDMLGSALTGQMHLREARPLLTRAFDLRLASLPPTDVTIAESLDHLGNFHFCSGDPQKAEEFYRRSLAIRESDLMAWRGIKAISTEVGRNRQLQICRTKSALALAIAYSLRESSQQAMDLLKESLADRIRLLGENHVEVAYARIVQAAIMARDLDSTGAFEEIQKAETILALNRSDRRVVQVFSLYAQGTAFQSLKMTNMAVDRFKEAERLMGEIFGRYHPMAIYIRGEIAGALERGGRAEEAIEMHRLVIEESEPNMSAQPYLAQSWDSLGTCLRVQNRAPEAIEAFEKALTIYRESEIDEPHILIAATKARLADCMTIVGRIEESFNLLEDAADQYDKLPRDSIGFKQYEALHFMSYLSMWHQSHRFPEVVSRVVSVGPRATKFEELEMLLLAGTSGECTQEQADVLLQLNDRMIDMALNESRMLFATHLRGRIYWQLERFDEALEVLSQPQPNELRDYQAKLYRSLCLDRLGEKENSRALFFDAVNSIIHRIPKSAALYLKEKMGEDIQFTSDDPEPTVLIEYHWEQSAYSEFAWRVLSKGHSEANSPR